MNLSAPMLEIFIFKTIDNQYMRKTIIFLIFIIMIGMVIISGCTSNTAYQTPNTGTSSISGSESTSSATIDPIIGIYMAKDSKTGSIYTQIYFPDGRFTLESSEYPGLIANGTWIRKLTNEYTVKFIDVNKTIDYIYNPSRDTISDKADSSTYFTRFKNVNTPTSVVTPSSQSNNRLTILESHKVIGEYGTVDVIGTAKNIGSSRISYGQINAKFYDKNGNLIGNGVTNINDLDPGETWSFKVMYLGTDGYTVASYKIGVGASF